MAPPPARQMPWNTPVEPVKWIPARSGCRSPASSTAAPGAYTRLITPGGRPASSSSFIVQYAVTIAVEAGFHTTVQPISAGDVVRFAPMAVKLKGLIASTKPSSGRYSRRFHGAGEELRGPQDDRDPLLPGRPAPVLPGRCGGPDRLLDLGCRALVDVREDVALVVRHHRLAGRAGPHLLAADDAGDVEAPAAHLL